MNSVKPMGTGFLLLILTYNAIEELCAKFEKILTTDPLEVKGVKVPKCARNLCNAKRSKHLSKLNSELKQVKSLSTKRRIKIFPRSSEGYDGRAPVGRKGATGTATNLNKGIFRQILRKNLEVFDRRYEN